MSNVTMNEIVQPGQHETQTTLTAVPKELPAPTDLSTKPSRTETLEEMEEAHGPIFSDSVHRYLVYYRHRDENKSYPLKSFTGCFLSVIVLTLQFSLYGTLVDEPIAIVQDDIVAVEIPYVDCGQYYGRHDIGNFYGQNNTLKYNSNTFTSQNGFRLQCEANQFQVWDKKNVGAFFLSLALLWIFTSADFFSCMAVFYRIPGCWAKLGGIALLIETFNAIGVCNLYLHAAFWQGDKFGAIVNVVGVLFIHDLDEFAYQALKILDKKWIKMEESKCIKCMCCCCCAFCKRNIRLVALIFWFIVIYIYYFISISYNL